MNDRIEAFIRKIEPGVQEFWQQLHRKPELSCEEYQTTEAIRAGLEAHGIACTVLEGGVGVTALIEGAKPGPCIAYRADIDALAIEEASGLDYASQNKGVMHACGHDVHAAVLYGTALVLQEFRSELSGKFRLIFQCGEEVLRGAKMAIESGVLDNPKVDAILALHVWPDLPVGSVGFIKGPCMAASTRVSFTVTGKGGHASAPHKSIDPVVVIAHCLTAIQSVVSRSVNPQETAVVSFCKIEAGSMGNVIPQTASALGTVRTYKSEVEDVVEERLKKLIPTLAESFGATAEVQYERKVPPVVNDSAMIDRLVPVAERTLGAENTLWLKEAATGSEDFAFYLGHVPGVMLRLGTSSELAGSTMPLHHCAVTFDPKCIETGIRYMVAALKEFTEN